MKWSSSHSCLCQYVLSSVVGEKYQCNLFLLLKQQLVTCCTLDLKSTYFSKASKVYCPTTYLPFQYLIPFNKTNSIINDFHNYKATFLFLSSKTKYYINVPREIELNPPSPVIIVFYYGLIKEYCYTSTEYPIIQIKALFTNESIFHA